MHQLTGDFYTVGQILGHSLKGIGIQLQLSNNLEAVTAQYVDVRMERKLYVLNIYHEAVLGSSEKTRSAEVRAMLMHRAHLRACRSTAVLRISFCDLSNCGNLTYFDIAFYRSLLR